MVVVSWLGDGQDCRVHRLAELGDEVVEAADEGGQGVGAGRFAQVILAGSGDLGLGAVEAEVIEDGVDVQEQET